MTTHTDLIARLRVIANAIADGNYSELTMRIPAEPDRDADIVVMSSALALESLEQQVAARTEQRDRAEQQVKELLWDDPVEPSFGPAFGDLLMYLNHQTPHPTEIYQMMSNGAKLWQQMKDQVAALTKDKKTAERIRLRQFEQLTALTKEKNDWYRYHGHVTDELVISQAREARLRGAMLSVLCDPEGVPCFSGSDGDRAVIAEALALPTDDSALMERLKQEREKVLQELHDLGALDKSGEFATAIRSMT